jgi:potassium-transporting ATPase potassium-binding subunit
MTINGWIQIAIFCAIVVALVKPLGWYMTAVFNGERTFLSPVLRPVESRLAGIKLLTSAKRSRPRTRTQSL